MSDQLDENLLRLYRNKDAPWAALLLSKLQPLFMQAVSAEERQPYLALGKTLAQWWPGQVRLLRDIYWQELAACWRAYDRTDETNAEALGAHQQLLTCAYIQLLVLDPFEKQRDPDRPALPNDLKTYGPQDFLALVAAACDRLAPATRRRIVDWIGMGTGAPAANWPEAEVILEGALRV